MIPPQTNPLASIRWLSIENDSGEEMPAHAAVVVDSSGDEGQFVISKPTTNSQHVWIAGPVPVLDGDYATATNTFPIDALYDDGDGTPAVGEIWGAGASSWKLRKNKTGFRVCGTPDTTKKIVPVERLPKDCCPSTPTVTPTTQPLSCTIVSGSGAGSGIEGVCCEVFLACDGSVTSICTGNTLSPYEVGEFTAACGDDMVVTWEICETFTCPGATWYCTGADDPCARLFASGNLCVNIYGGTRAYRAITATGVNVTAFFTPGGWNIRYAIGDADGNTTFEINGALKWCVLSGVPGLYFFGTIRSTADDTSNPGTYPCGCFAKLDGCTTFASDGSEVITAGPAGSACELTSETLKITTACGVLYLGITSGLCTSPPPPPPPTTTCACSACAGGAPGRWALPANGTLPAIPAVDYVSGCLWFGTNASGNGVSASILYNGSAWSLVYSGGGVTLATYEPSAAYNCCASNTWNLVSSDPGITVDASVTATTAQSCSCPGPPAESYDCVTVNGVPTCVDPGDGSGAYASLAACIAAPCATTIDNSKYYCIATSPNTCSSGTPSCLLGSLVSTGTMVICGGPYDSEAQCVAGCGGGGGPSETGEACCDKLAGRTCTLVMPDGTTAVSVWESDAFGRCFVWFRDDFNGAGTNTILMLLEDGTWVFSSFFTGSYASDAATLVQCSDPTAIHTADAAVLGDVGTITFVTALS